MSNLDYFSRGLIKAFERQRAMQQQTKVEKVGNISTTAIITTQIDHDEQYRTTTIQNMLNYINQRKEETNHD
ncbi:hypothetical protein [Pseudomonas sp. URMO17WK12:I12]|uniref:hypothetical protein n=1 Tax=Pseudomonas sp. URMO17WK12:I12 TaxID=1259797 RepID=UPI0012DCCD59|nr:hypothetical protein [Pseudomonas sp. URMO17WK12:I12]